MSLYEIAIPAYLQMLNSLQGLIAKAEAHCAAKNLPPEELFGARLYPDMLPFSTQIMRVCDHATRGCARLTGSAIPSVPDTETTLAQLKQRLQNTVAYVNTFTARQFEGSDSREITFPIGPEKT